MRETVKFSDEQKAIIRAICKQFDDNLAPGLVTYDPIKAHHFMVTNGDFAKYKLNIPKQFKILEELSAMDNIGIEVKILENEVDTEENCVTDALYGRMCLTEESSEEDEQAFDIRVSFGSVYIQTNIDDIDWLRALCEEYTAKLLFSKNGNYSVEVYSEGSLVNTYHYPRLHDGKRPRIIVEYAMKPTNAGKTLTKDELNSVLRRKDAASIGARESILSTVFAHEKASLAVLSYFFDIQPSSIRYLGPIANGLTRLDVDILENNVKH